MRSPYFFYLWLKWVRCLFTRLTYPRQAQNLPVFNFQIITFCPCSTIAWSPSRYTARLLINLNATVTSWLLAGTAWLTTKRCKGFPDESQVSLHKNNKINLKIIAVSVANREVAVSFNFISERNVCGARYHGSHSKSEESNSVPRLLP
jgi:hypothetical protein